MCTYSTGTRVLVYVHVLYPGMDVKKQSDASQSMAAKIEFKAAFDSSTKRSGTGNCFFFIVFGCCSFYIISRACISVSTRATGLGLLTVVDTSSPWRNKW